MFFGWEYWKHRFRFTVPGANDTFFREIYGFASASFKGLSAVSGYWLSDSTFQLFPGTFMLCRPIKQLSTSSVI